MMKTLISLGLLGSCRGFAVRRVTKMVVSSQMDPTLKEGGLLEGERYVAMNRFAIREGSEAKFEARWANRKSRLAELPGFRYFHLMKRCDMENSPDEFNYRSLTIWEKKVHHYKGPKRGKLR